MTQAQAERITGGMTILALPGAGKRLHFAAVDRSGVLRFEAQGYGGPSKVLTFLVDAIYRATKELVFKEQGWQCAVCLRYEPLQAHHMIPRSKGRDDRRENLIGLCQHCHEMADVEPLLPAQKILDKIRKAGYEWDASVPVWRKL